jgi:hypothetical protein
LPAIKTLLKKFPKKISAKEKASIRRTVAAAANSPPPINMIMPSARNKIPIISGIIRMTKTLNVLLDTSRNLFLSVKIYLAIKGKISPTIIAGKKVMFSKTLLAAL